jgi:hypothetical protein
MTEFTAKKMKSSVVLQFQAPPGRVFPLLCPVREYEWIEPWNCEMLHSDSGIAEKNCVFRTGFFGEPSKIGLPGEPLSDVWVINHYEPNSRIEFVRMNALRISLLSCTLTDNGDGTTRSVVEQFLVGLTEQGNESLKAIAEHFSFEWHMGEAMLNHYLTTGKMLISQDAISAATKQK